MKQKNIKVQGSKRYRDREMERRWRLVDDSTPCLFNHLVVFAWIHKNSFLTTDRLKLVNPVIMMVHSYS